MACPLQVKGEQLPHLEEFRYLGVLFMCEGKLNLEIDQRLDSVAAVMWALYRTVVLKKEQSRKAKPSIYQIYPTFTYGHELWVVTKRVRWQIQAT